eukprot:GABV01004219.1.p1 GENE.GABV01004219.1~~GABV01004219.1.p1  ORF type:complete len:105 (+),score=40.76 GABV01004219.1:143-457(+)
MLLPPGSSTLDDENEGDLQVVMKQFQVRRKRQMTKVDHVTLHAAGGAGGGQEERRGAVVGDSTNPSTTTSTSSTDLSLAFDSTDTPHVELKLSQRRRRLLANFW